MTIHSGTADHMIGSMRQPIINFVNFFELSFFCVAESNRLIIRMINQIIVVKNLDEDRLFISFNQ